MWLQYFPAENFFKSSSELLIEDGVENRIHRGVAISQPLDHGVNPDWILTKLEQEENIVVNLELVFKVIFYFSIIKY